jgi:S1-C subfamily serine protease
MIFPKLPDWAIYASVVAALVIASLSRRETADAPEAPPPVIEAEGGALGAASVFDPAIIVRASPTAAPALGGTAFSVSSRGVWLTARHAVEGCRKVALMVNPGSGVVADVHLSGRGDVAVLTTLGGPPGLPLALNGPLHVGERGYHPGFPLGQPGEVTSRLIGRQTLVVRWPKRLRGSHAEQVVAWAEAGRTEGLAGDLSGLSGAPVLDHKGYVVGLTLAEAPRRARLYSATPENIARSLRVLRLTPQQNEQSAPQALTTENYGRSADTLRRDLQVAPVRCVEL